LTSRRAALALIETGAETGAETAVAAVSTESIAKTFAKSLLT
jgi:hypothetical protein